MLSRIFRICAVLVVFICVTFFSCVNATANVSESIPDWKVRDGKRQEIFFKSIQSGQDLYYQIVRELKKLQRERKEMYPIIGIPFKELPEKVWMELETCVKVSTKIAMDYGYKDGEEIFFFYLQ